MESVSVVIPAYNEEERLPETLLRLQQWISLNRSVCNIVEVIVVDDGSRDKTASCVTQLGVGWPLLKLISLSENQGKGAAVHAGMNVAKAPWILVADADEATPWSEISGLVPYLTDNDMVMGSRALEGSLIMRRQHWFRQGMGKTFNRLLRFLMGVPFKDTQCGFKFVKNGSLFRTQVLPDLAVQRFAWDVELILLMLKRGLNIREVPVRWEHKEQSRVRIVRDSFEMLGTVIKLKIALFFQRRFES